MRHGSLSAATRSSASTTLLLVSIPYASDAQL
jgi:hypothetical protein